MQSMRESRGTGEMRVSASATRRNRGKLQAAPIAFLRLAVGVLFGVTGCGRAPLPDELPVARFTEASATAGVDFVHEDGGFGRFYYPELMGPGCAFADFTGDGMPDLYLVNGSRLAGASPGEPPSDRLYRNNGDGTFQDVTAAAGLRERRYGIGCCAGDFDNDGDLDLYVTNVGRNTLYRNEGNGTFRDVTTQAGVGAGGFSSSAAFGDADNDGDLDLYVCRYILWSPARNILCEVETGEGVAQGQCRPVVYPPAPDIFYRNNGDGTFTDVTSAAGMDPKPGRGLGVVWFDCDADGDQDLYVANDMTANFLFINHGKGKFSEEAFARGAAVSDAGMPQASMGVSVVDYDADGHLDVACTNFSDEYLALYRNSGGGRFEDVSASTGLAQITAPFVGFGLNFQDYDLDGYPDLFVVNGHVSGVRDSDLRNILAQPALFLMNDRRGGFIPAARPGETVTSKRVARGLASADFDRDGDLDVLVANWTARTELLRNELPRRQHWVRLRPEGTRANRSGIGARVELTAGGRRQVQVVQSGGSYGSQNELPLTFGLDQHRTVERIRVSWPGGGTDVWQNLAADREYVLRER